MHIPIPWRRRGAVLFTLGAVLCGPAAPATALSSAAASPPPAVPAASPAASPAARAGDGGAAPVSPLACRLGEKLTALRGADLETAFLAGIIAHDEAAVAMARLELDRGTDSALRARAQTLITAHQRQVEQFTGWLRQWYAMTPAQALARLSPDVRTTLAALEQEVQRLLSGLRGTGKGTGFDQAYADMMIPLHTSGLIQFLEPQARAVHAELRSAAATGATGQESEIAGFSAWLAGRGASAATVPGTAASAPVTLPKGAADTGEGAAPVSPGPVVAAGCALAAAGAGVGTLLLRRRRRAARD
ncbi:DUF305 domain-containing protein [Streptomyces sp. NPDC003703]|uniref:DUF305 domain-containing protein n=1 Tax=Streptomyces sp. NPDC003283 TaxID=3364681 RepID=UPI0036B84D19